MTKVTSIKLTSKPSFARRFLRDERGLSSVEYVILLAIIAIGGISLWTNVGKEVGGQLTEAETQIRDL